MGCDIHMHQEVKISGQWHHYRDVPTIHRSYILFEKMAGVRGDIEEAIIPPRGIPWDATFLTRHDFETVWEDDAHTPSWFGVEEIKKLSQWFKDQKVSFGGDWDFYGKFGFCFGNGWVSREGRDQVEDVRWIFWFDN